MSSPLLEAFLARLYSDQALLAVFLREPEAVAREAGLTDSEVAALTAINHDGLVMAAHSFLIKRQAARRRRWSWLPGR